MIKYWAEKWPLTGILLERSRGRRKDAARFCVRTVSSTNPEQWIKAATDYPQLKTLHLYGYRMETLYRWNRTN
jgi:hypothetical protein